jgi:ubiquinol-cytochrome c reductase subunit 7
MSLPTAAYERIAQTIKSSRILSAVLTPLAKWNANAAGYRRLGMVYGMGVWFWSARE